MMAPRGRGRRGRGVGGRASAGERRRPRMLSAFQRSMTVLAVLLMALAITREPARTTVVVDDINAPVHTGSDIIAQRSFKAKDLDATLKAEQEAMAAVPDHYSVDQRRVEARRGQLTAAIVALEAHREPAAEAILAAIADAPEDAVSAEAALEAAVAYVAQAKAADAWPLDPEAADETAAVWLMPDETSLPKPPVKAASGDGPTGTNGTNGAPAPAEPTPPVLTYTKADRLAELAVAELAYVLAEGVLPDNAPRAAADTLVELTRDESVGGLPVGEQRNLAEILRVEAARTERLPERLTDAARDAAAELGAGASWARLQEAALALTAPLVTDTLSFNRVATNIARDQAKNNVEPVTQTIHASTMVQEANKEWTAQSRENVKTYLSLLEQEERPWRTLLSEILGKTLLVVLVVFCLYRSVGVFAFDQTEDFARYFTMSLLLMVVTLAVGRVVSYFEPSGYVVPGAAVGILLAILCNVRLAAIVSILAALLLSAQYHYDWRLLLILSAMSVAGTFSIYKVRRRSDMAAASIKATVFGILAMCAITLAMDSFALDTAARRFLLISLNGAVCLLVVPGLLSPLERLFKVTTDIQLLEYSDLNNELLSQLAIHAPGSYAHSQFLGQLAEAAADAIGANGLLARVCAYYHDIGKMRRSEYFVENQTGENIHDQLSPRLSARAIAAHVTQGAELAREYHLPQPIIDGILEHHGTCLIGFFYQQALEQQKHGDVQEEDFRYPGPRPQRPETAILMICDASESAARTIKNPTEERIREMVDKLISARAADRQFDDCNLTLRQLDTISGIVSKRIMSSLHARISYPEPRRDDHLEVSNVIPMQGGGE